MEKIIKIVVDMGIDPTQAIIIYKVLDTIQMIIALAFIAVAAKWIAKKIMED